MEVKRSLCNLGLVLTAALAAAAAAPPNLPQAIAAQRALAAERPADAAVQVDLGNLLALGGQSDEAEAAYRQALALDPESVSAHFNLALLEQQRRHERAALREFKAVIELDPRHAWAQYQIGVILEGWGMKELAVRAYGRALALDPRLRFPDVNPHVIDNRLLTEAMLLGYRDYQPEVLPPPAYEQPRRIAALLLATPEAPAPTAPAAAAITPRPQVARPPGEQPAEELVLESSPESGGGNFARVLDAGDLRGGGGQATPVVVGGVRVDDARGGATPRPDSPAQRGIGPETPYFPGEPSTGRLDLKLMLPAAQASESEAPAGR